MLSRATGFCEEFRIKAPSQKQSFASVLTTIQYLATGLKRTRTYQISVTIDSDSQWYEQSRFYVLEAVNILKSSQAFRIRVPNLGRHAFAIVVFGPPINYSSLTTYRDRRRYPRSLCSLESSTILISRNYTLIHVSSKCNIRKFVTQLGTQHLPDCFLYRWLLGFTRQIDVIEQMTPESLPPSRCSDRRCR
jgi:hypothetical protein